MVKLTLEDNEYKLLMSILKDALEDRTNMCCNDPYKSEEKLFTLEERIKMNKDMWGDEFDDGNEENNDGFLFNSDYVSFIIDKIKTTKEKV